MFIDKEGSTNMMNNNNYINMHKFEVNKIHSLCS